MQSSLSFEGRKFCSVEILCETKELDELEKSKKKTFFSYSLIIVLLLYD